MVNLYCPAPISKTFAFIPHCFDGKVVVEVEVDDCQVVLGLLVRDIIGRCVVVGFGPQAFDSSIELEQRGI